MIYLRIFLCLLGYGLTPDELMAGGFSPADEKDNLEIILPNGDTPDVVSAKAPDASTPQPSPAAVLQSVPAGGMPSRVMSSPAQAVTEHYSRPLKVGTRITHDVRCFKACPKVYNIDRGNIEPIQDSTQLPGFYKEGKAAYYPKGQILGKYLVTSSFDTDCQQKKPYSGSWIPTSIILFTGIVLLSIMMPRTPRDSRI